MKKPPNYQLKIEQSVSPKIGEKFTIEGFGFGSKGQTVIDGRNVATGRKCKVVKLTTYVNQCNSIDRKRVG